MSVVVADIVRLGAVTSTMDALHALAEGGAAAGTAVVAQSQTAGRGSRGRSWTSPPGGLWLSVLSRPAAAGLELVSLRAGLAVAEALARLGAGDRIRIKWPNDLMLDDRKAGGILCEARWQGASLAWIVIGLGLNVENRPPAGLEALAARLGDVLPGVTVDALIEPVIAAVRGVDAAAGLLTDAEHARFAARDWLRGRAIGAPVVGTAVGVADDGALLVRRPGSTTAAVRAGTVILTDDGAASSARPAI
ncbi:MAG TPA: biotin--[acetyl-CoA-carboxylase] ligase [Gemmatimonadales bacterium]|nr:biotin--[acetyl-CoA-carboxylase] ligase [Gemmatimonadales bacterium]